MFGVCFGRAVSYTLVDVDSASSGSTIGAEQIDHRLNGGAGQSRGRIDRVNVGVRHGGADEAAFQLVLVSHIDRVLGATGHLDWPVDPRRSGVRRSVELPSARPHDGVVDAEVRAAPAQVPR